MAQELLSTDAKAGELLSSDPAAGLPPPTGDRHQPHMSASIPGPLAWPADASAPRVTYEDVIRDPVGSMKTIGQIVKRDVSDPKLWLGLALSYFGPKVFNVAAPVIARAAAKTAAVAGEVATPGMAKDLGISVLGNERVSAGLRIADRVRNAMKTASTPVPAAPAPTQDPMAEGYDRYMPNASGTTPAPVVATPSAPAPVETPVAAPGTAPPPAPAVPAPPAVSAPAPAALSPARLANEVALQARRQSVQLSAAEDTAAQTLVRDHGASPADAVATVKAGRDLPTKLKLTPEEATQYQTLKQQGKSGGEAEAAILKLRSLAKKLKTPATGAVEDAVRQRNETGRWEDQ